MILFVLIIWLYYNKYNLDLKINLIAALVVLLALIKKLVDKYDIVSYILLYESNRYY
jgi:hypothetical protein